MIRFVKAVQRAVVEIIPPVEHWICPKQRSAEPCDCVDCRMRSNIKLVTVAELRLLYPPEEPK
jgi:hypothetical protein